MYKGNFMKKFTLLALLFIGACSVNPISSSPDISLKKPTKEQLVQEAAGKCQALGFDQGTKEFRDCTVKEFDKMQDKYY
jgi:hypothetical protein